MTGGRERRGNKMVSSHHDGMNETWDGMKRLQKASTPGSKLCLRTPDEEGC